MKIGFAAVAALAFATAADAQDATVLKLEQYLSILGFNPGAVDGIIEQSTYNAIAGYQQSKGLPVTGGMDLAGFQALEADALAAGNAAAAPAAPVAPAPAAPAAAAPAAPAGGFVHHKMEQCPFEKGLGNVVYWKLNDVEVELTDVCFDRNGGNLYASEPVQGLQLVRQADESLFYEVVASGDAPHNRMRMHSGTYSETDPGQEIGAVYFGYSDARRSARRIADAHDHSINGYFFKESFGPAQVQSPMSLWISGHDYHSHKLRGYGSGRGDGETPYIALEGKISFSAGQGVAQLTQTSDSTGPGSGQLDLVIGPDGKISGGGSFVLENGRLAGARPIDWKTDRVDDPETGGPHDRKRRARNSCHCARLRCDH